VFGWNVEIERRGGAGAGAVALSCSAREEIITVTKDTCLRKITSGGGVSDATPRTTVMSHSRSDP